MSDAGETTLTTQIGEIAAGLERLAGLLRDPRAAGSLPTFSDQLEVMASHARAAEEVLAAVEVEAAEDEPSGTDTAALREAGWTEDKVAALRRDPVALGRDVGGDEPLTRHGVGEAVQTLGRFVARPLPPDATDRERVAQAEAAAAVRMLQRMVESMAPVWKDLTSVAAHHKSSKATGENDPTTPSLVASLAAVQRAASWIDIFDDAKKAGLSKPFYALAKTLDEARNGTTPRFRDRPNYSPGAGNIGSIFFQQLRGAAAALVRAKGEMGTSKAAACVEVANIIAFCPTTGKKRSNPFGDVDAKRVEGFVRQIENFTFGKSNAVKSQHAINTFKRCIQKTAAFIIAERDPKSRLSERDADRFRDPETGLKPILHPASLEQAEKNVRDGKETLSSDDWARVAAGIENWLRQMLDDGGSSAPQARATPAGEEPLFVKAGNNAPFE